jgi:hypothetical protein
MSTPAAAPEVLVSLSRANDYLPPGVPPADRTSWARWLRRGVGGVRLKGTRRGARWFVRPTDITEFFERLNQAPEEVA